MYLHEVKIGDIVTFKNTGGKSMKGKVIHRHDGKTLPHLANYVNIQPEDKSTYPKTIHVSQIKPFITEDVSMEHISENIDALVNSIQSDNNLNAVEAFNMAMQEKINAVLEIAKETVASNMFNTTECEDCNEEVEGLEEKLSGKQYKLDANHNGKLDANDFKMIRREKESAQGEKKIAKYRKMTSEEVESLDELKQSTYQSYHDKAVTQTGRGKGVYTATKMLKKTKESEAAKFAAAKAEYNKGEVQGLKTKKGVQQASKKLFKSASHDTVVHDPKTGETHFHGETTPSYTPSFSRTKKTPTYYEDVSKENKKEETPKVKYKKAKSQERFDSRFKEVDSNYPYRADESFQIDEVITKSTPTSEVIDDFVNSKNPKFAGKSKKERIRMALGAKYAMMRKEEVEYVEEATLSAKAARAGKDIGKKGKMFKKIEKSAAKRYGSKESGKRVAGAVLARLRANKGK
jgi:hypothetical protein